MISIEIKKAVIADLEALQQISTQTFTETFASENSVENLKNYLEESFNLEKLRSEINNPDSHFYLALSGSETVGYLKINFRDAQTEKMHRNAIEIHRVYVLKAFHGKKIGQLLLDQAIKIAKESKAEYIWLGVWEENHNALNFYTKNNFIQFDKHIFTLGDDKQTDLLLQFKIT